MKKRDRQSKVFEWSGIIIFPIVIALIIQIAVLVFDYIEERGSIGAISMVMLVVILSLTAIATTVDVIRRKLTIINPVNKILDATDKIATGDFSARVEINSRYGRYSKYDLIAENINKMASELGKNEMISSDFISNVSHEMKTPLAVIKNYTKALLNEDLDKETREKYAETVTIAMEKLDSLIVNVLKLTKLENSEIIPEKEKVLFSDVIAEAVIGQEDKIEQKNIQLDCEIEEVSHLTDRGCVEIIVNNLISNAVKFTSNDGNIKIILKKTADGVLFSVEDSGVGIPKDIGARIFDKFYQCDRSRKQEGNGLGLALVKRAIDVIGGEITVVSQEKKGSTFSVLFK